MKRKVLPLLLALASLAACQGQSSSEQFSFTDDTTNVYMTRNGDNYGKSGLSHAYPSMCRPFSKDRLEKTLASGRSMFLFLYADFCSHCEDAHNDLTRFFLTSGVEVEGVHFADGSTSETYKELMSFVNAHEGISSVFGSTVRTPTIYLVKDERKTLKLEFMSQRETLQNLYDYFSGIINFTCVYNFNTYDAFASFYKEHDCLIYRDSSEEETPSFFYSNIYQTAIHSPKITVHIETEYVSEEDNAKFDALLSGNAYEAKKGELTPIPSSTLTADWISAYYA